MVQDHAPLVESAVQVEPVFVQVPVDTSVSVADVAVATESWTVAVTGAEPVKVNVRFVVMLSVVDVPLSEAVARSGVAEAGST